MLLYVVFFIITVVLITIFYIKRHLNKGEENKILPKISEPVKNEIEQVPDEQNLSFDVRNNQTVEIDTTKKAIKKIVRRYSNINSLTVQTEVPDLIKEENTKAPGLENISISTGSAFDDIDIDFDTISDQENQPSLSELTSISEIVSDKGETELYKILDVSLHDKISNQLEQISQGVSDDDDLMDEFKSFKFANSYAENTNDIFNDLDNVEDEEGEEVVENEEKTPQKNEIFTDHNEKSLNFTENLNSATDSTLDFNFDFEEVEENDN